LLITGNTVSYQDASSLRRLKERTTAQLPPSSAPTRAELDLTRGEGKAMAGLETNQVASFLLFLAAYNLCACILMGWDKHQARRDARRVPERMLFAVALTGGAPGIMAGMYLFHHKTRHLSFVFGIPAIIALQLGLLWWSAR
jgi:uncharacterized membrane protein YsdA (DUF1294 family)